MLQNAFNYDQLKEHVDGGGTLDARQQAVHAELQVKVPAQKQLLHELAEAEKASQA
jgi:hypothetical protein